MLKVDDRFKWWMRTRLQDRKYAERVLRAVTELDDAVLGETWNHAAFPEYYPIDNDPEAMIGYLKGHSPSAGQSILVGLFGKWEDMEDLMMPYTRLFWSMHPMTSPEDEANLPTLYLIAFKDLERDEAISHVRWRDQDGVEATCFGFDKHKINVINTGVDSDLIQLITGGKRTMDEPDEISQGIRTTEQIKTDLA